MRLWELLVWAGQSSRVPLLLAAALGAGIAFTTYTRRRNAKDGHGGLDPEADSPTLTAMGVFVAALALTLAGLGPATRTLWLLSLLPAMMITHHAMYVLNVSWMKLPGATSQDPNTERSPEFSRTRKAIAQARKTNFGLETLALQYGVPAFLTILLVLTVGYVLFCMDFTHVLPAGWLSDPKARTQVQMGARFGFAGAYVFVLLNLAQRTIRRDLTSGIAAWAAATLVLGPVLATVTALVWHGVNPDADVTYTSELVYFFAGFAPRQVANVLAETARRLLTSDSQRAASRITPLNQIRGITLEIEERLSEEGIMDVAGLAMADPFRLMRNTSFDKRQIVSWMDAAILMITLPTHWQRLENSGITGAIDLAVEALRPDGEKGLEKIAGADSGVVYSAATRLSEDAQVHLIWGIYQLESPDEGLRNVNLYPLAANGGMTGPSAGPATS